MQTFMPYANFSNSAKALDDKRLGKQRVEAKQIYTALTTGKGWIHHPATKMWAGYEASLAYYGFKMCEEYFRRGHGVESELYLWFWKRSVALGKSIHPPEWVSDVVVQQSHRSNLLRKDPEFYRPKFLLTPPDLEYAWPKFYNGVDHAYVLELSKPGQRRVDAGELRDPRLVNF